MMCFHLAVIVAKRRLVRCRGFSKCKYWARRGKGKIAKLIWLPFVPGCVRSLILLLCTYRLANVPLHLHPLPSEPAFRQKLHEGYLNYFIVLSFSLACISLRLPPSLPPFCISIKVETQTIEIPASRCSQMRGGARLRWLNASVRGVSWAQLLGLITAERLNEPGELSASTGGAVDVLP